LALGLPLLLAVLQFFKPDVSLVFELLQFVVDVSEFRFSFVAFAGVIFVGVAGFDSLDSEVASSGTEWTFHYVLLGVVLVKVVAERRQPRTLLGAVVVTSQPRVLALYLIFAQNVLAARGFDASQLPGFLILHFLPLDKDGFFPLFRHFFLLLPLHFLFDEVLLLLLLLFFLLLFSSTGLFRHFGVHTFDFVAFFVFDNFFDLTLVFHVDLVEILLVDDGVVELYVDHGGGQELLNAALHDRHLEDVMHPGALLAVSHQQRVHQVFEFLALRVGDGGVGTLDDFAGQLLQGVGVEWGLQGAHLLKQHAQRPDVTLE